MNQTFACPECGEEVTLRGATPGREVLCAQCETWIEVPYLPRTGVWTRSRFQKSKYAKLIPLAWVAVGLFALFVIVVTAIKVFESKTRQARDASVAEFVRAADAAEKARRPDRALSELEAAIAYLRNHESNDSTQLDKLKRRRDLASLREAEARIESAARLDPDQALGELLTLQARGRTDRVLDSLSSTILTAIETARKRRLDLDFESARKASSENRPLDAIALVEHCLIGAEKLDSNLRRVALTDAETILRPIVARQGVIISQLPGQYSLGSVNLYDAGLVPILADALRRQGYAPRPTKGLAQTFWDQFAPVRFEFQIVEILAETYLQSMNRTTEITAKLSFRKGAEILWQNRITARTQVPLPDLRAFAASRIAVGDKRGTETERLLYENAKSVLFDQVSKAARAVPSL